MTSKKILFFVISVKLPILIHLLNINVVQITGFHYNNESSLVCFSQIEVRDRREPRYGVQRLH